MIYWLIDGLYRGVSYCGYLQYRDFVSWQNFCIVTSLVETEENIPLLLKINLEGLQKLTVLRGM